MNFSSIYWQKIWQKKGFISDNCHEDKCRLQYCQCNSFQSSIKLPSNFGRHHFQVSTNDIWKNVTQIIVTCWSLYRKPTFKVAQIRKVLTSDKWTAIANRAKRARRNVHLFTCHHKVQFYQKTFVRKQFVQKESFPSIIYHYKLAKSVS